MGSVFKWPTILCGLLCVAKLISPTIISWGWCFAPLWITLMFVFAVFIVILLTSFFIKPKHLTN
jgi:hypothetical protein